MSASLDIHLNQAAFDIAVCIRKRCDIRNRKHPLRFKLRLKLRYKADICDLQSACFGSARPPGPFAAVSHLVCRPVQQAQDKRAGTG
jgi:hypothetical protein